MVKKICILVATYKRKSSLIKLLKSLENLHIPRDANIHVLISANDNQNYSEILKLFKNSLKIKIIRERKKGISNARNKYLEEIRFKNYDYFAFFDDDVQVDKKWLVEMLKFIKKNKVEIIGGPQLTKSHSLFSNLLIRDEKHEAKIKWVSTNNCFVKKIVLKNNLNFSKKLNLIGGEDQLFFMLQNKKGFEVSWNQKAKVFEEKNENVDMNIVENSMLFLMKDNVEPLWEHENNINGGCWSFKISKGNLKNSWEELSVKLIG